MLGFQTESGMSRPFKTEGVYVQSIARQNGLCPDFPALNKLLCFHIQAFVSSPDFRALLVRLLCVQQTFVLSCSVFKEFARLECLRHISSVHFPCNFGHRKPFSCVHLRSGHT